MKRRNALALGLLLIAATTLAFAPQEKARSPLQHRLLGPFAELVADVQWIRFSQARQNGQTEHAFYLAESALSLNPQSTAGWELFAWHLSTHLASHERVSDPEKREAWFRAGLEVARRGSEVADDPLRLDRVRGFLLLQRAYLAGEQTPKVQEYLREACEIFEATADRGDELSGELALQVKAMLR